MSSVPPPSRSPSSARPDAPASPLSALPGDSIQQLLNALPEAVLCIGSDWRITFANPEAMRLSRLRPEDIGRDHWELYPETLGTNIERTYRRAMTTRAEEQFEFFYPPFGTWYDLKIVPLANGSLLFYYRDVTATHTVAAERDRSSREVVQLLAASPDALVVIDRHWNFTYSNQQAFDILGTTDFIGTNIWDRFPGNRTEPFNSTYRSVMQDRVAAEFEAFNGPPLNRWYRVHVRPFGDGEIIVFFSDITTRKLVELDRDRTADRLQQILDVSSDGILTIDRQFTITLLNRSARAILGPKAGILGANLWNAFPDTDATVRRNYQRAMFDGVSSVTRAFYPDPLNQWFEIRLFPTQDGVVNFFRDITSERESTHFLEQQGHLLSFIQAAARVATFNLNLDTSELVWGSGSAEVLGQPLTSLRTFEDLLRIIRPDLSLSTADLLRILPRNEVITRDYPVALPDGAEAWVEIRGQIDPTSGQPSFVRGMLLDITARRSSEQALRDSEERYRILADLNPQYIWSAAPDGSITYANQILLDYLGPGKNPVLGPWVQGIAEPDRARAIEAWTHSIATGEPYDIELRLLNTNNQLRWFQLRAQAVHDPAGYVTQWLGVAIDIHDRRIAAAALEERQRETERERAELETVYRTAPIGLALFDPVEFRYLRLNDRQAEFFSLPPDQLVGKTVTEMAPIPGLQEMFEGVAAGTPVINHLLEGELSSRPGEHRFWTVNYFPVFATDGSVQAISAASLEITQQKKAEAALMQSEKLAAVGRLASSISHEINNPLEAITNLLYLVSADDTLPGNLRNYVNLAQSELSRVSQIATQTLRFHRQAVRPTRVSAAQLVDAVLNLYQGRLSNSGIHVEASYSTTSTVLCFENDIRQVLNNLIGNAIDAMRSGGRLIARAHATTDVHTGRHGLRITIADTGHGMSETTRRRIFEPFFTTKDLNGTGLGLWISAEIVSRHHGHLTVRSSEHPVHHGTIFSLFLPDQSADITPSSSPQPTPSPASNAAALRPA